MYSTIIISSPQHAYDLHSPMCFLVLVLIRVSGTASVDQLAAVIVQEANLPTGSRFTLSAGFPPKELDGGASTVNENNLAGAAITLKLV
jgi:hypothetical protein